MSEPLDYLALGHVTLDRQPDGGVLPGGTVLFAAVQAARLGLRAGMITAGNPAALAGPLAPYREMLAIELRPADETTIFTNVGVGAARLQTVGGWARPLDLADLAVGARIVHLGPVARELDPARLPPFPPGTLVGATPQGWLRRWADGGRVTLHPLHLPASLLARLDALILSETEAPLAETAIAAVRATGGIVAITRDDAGCTLLDRDGARDVPTRAYPLVDDTGAGDIFAAAFLVALAEGRSRVGAAEFANAAAGLSIGGRGVSGIAGRAEVERAMGEGREG